MARVPKKESQAEDTRGILKQLLCRENIVAAVAVFGAISGAFLYFSHKNHVVATISTESASVDGVGSQESLAIPLNLTVNNLGDGPITVNSVFFAFPDPRGDNPDCNKWISLGDNGDVQKVVVINSSSSSIIKGVWTVPTKLLSSEVCLVIHWRDQSEYQRGFVRSVGSYSGVAILPSEDGRSVVIHPNGGIIEVVSIFPKKNCMSVLKFQVCI